MFQNADRKILLKNVEKNSTLHSEGDKLGTYYLSKNPKYFEPQRTNTFIFYVEGLKGKLETSNAYARDNAEDILKISVNSASVPHVKISALELKRGNAKMKFAGEVSFDAGKITLTDFIGAGTKDVLLAWQKQAYDIRTEKIGLASDYKMDGYLLEYTPEYQLVRTWVLEGCWIGDISEEDYDHDNVGIKMIDATIHYDKAYVDTRDTP